MLFVAAVHSISELGRCNIEICEVRTTGSYTIAIPILSRRSRESYCSNGVFQSKNLSITIPQNSKKVK